MSVAPDRPERRYVCKTCRAEFVLLENDRAVCCPVCRMNRIVPRQ